MRIHFRRFDWQTYFRLRTVELRTNCTASPFNRTSISLLQTMILDPCSPLSLMAIRTRRKSRNVGTLRKTCCAIDLREEFTAALEADVPPRDLRRHVTVETNRGRKERREYYALPAPRTLTARRPTKPTSSCGRRTGSHATCRVRDGREVRPAHNRGHWFAEKPARKWSLTLSSSAGGSICRSSG